MTGGQEQEAVETRRKGSAWVGKEEIPEEEESDDDNHNDQDVKTEQEALSLKNANPEASLCKSNNSQINSADKQMSDSKIDSKETKNKLPSPSCEVSKQIEPAASTISTTTIIISKEKDDSSKLHEETPSVKMKDGCNLGTKEDCNPRVTRQRRQGRLELQLSNEPDGVRSQFLIVPDKSTTPTTLVKKQVDTNLSGQSKTTADNDKINVKDANKSSAKTNETKTNPPTPPAIPSPVSKDDSSVKTLKFCDNDNIVTSAANERRKAR